jgi:tetratricopeptide (TPR) repeat protein
MLSSAAFEANHRGAIRSTLATLLLVLLFAATMQAQGEDDIDCRSLVNEDRRAICDHDRKQKEREREWDAALAEVNQAIALKGDDTNFYLRRAELYDKKGNTEQAIADLTRAAELSPDD